ncbi:FAD-dependent oxidoreductase [Hyphomicrobium sp. xq]|uniref:FAD-dependent oxidoreductase n=2 Tax=Hyphomicrobium album TaxID=2665159 RepID=A0A6I3KG15_9HYPH|nr:FAD-dependent oxidoreductase [Hyphomicrobium album]
MASSGTLATTCCVVGGGPAGMVLGLLLARAGIDVVVLEKHADFLRDFRGDTIHPSTLEVMDELGLLDDLLKLPHNKVSRLGVQVGDTSINFADFTWLPPRHAFIALMPQWDFLDFLADEARKYPNFKLIMQANVTDLVEERGRVVGVRATTPEGPLEVRAKLTVGCDGRKSTVRAKAGLEVEDIGAPIDVFWMRVSRRPDDPPSGGRLNAGSFFAMLDRGDYFQLAYVIPKDTAEKLREQGLPAFREIIAKALPFLADRVDELKTWDDVKLLTVSIDRLRTWYRPGLLCIGDAAHAMSPIGGVGINLAIQDAVAAANILWKPLKDGTLSTFDLAKVQHRRTFPTRVTQRLQVLAQNRIVQPVLSSNQPLQAPRAVSLFNRLPFLQRIPARIVGVGVRPEHVKSPAAPRPT